MGMILHFGNRDAKFYDNTGVECDAARLAISEAIDDGRPVSPSVDAHTEDCAACRRWPPINCDERPCVP
jgi:hypothetical protein